MKLVATLIASLVALTAFAAEPAKKEEKKVAPAVTAQAAPHKADTPAKHQKAAPAKEEAKK